MPELAGAIVELLDDEPFRRRLAAAGRAKALERYDWERSTGLLEALYEGLRTRIPDLPFSV